MAAKNWEESQLTDKEPLPIALSQKLVLGVRNILLSHSEISPQGKTQICLNKQENGFDPQTTLRTDDLERSSGLPSATGHPPPHLGKMWSHP